MITPAHKHSLEPKASSFGQDVHTTQDDTPKSHSLSSLDANLQELERRELIFFLRKNLAQLTRIVGELDEAEKVCEDYEKGDVEYSKMHHDHYLRGRDRYATICHDFVKKAEFMINSVKGKVSSLELVEKPSIVSFDPGLIKVQLKSYDRSIYHARFNDLEGVVTTTYSIPDEYSPKLLYVIEAYDYETNSVVFKRDSYDEKLKTHCPFYCTNGQLYDISGTFLAKIKNTDQSYCLTSMYQLEMENSITCFFQFQHGVCSYLGVGTSLGTYFFVDDKISFILHYKAPQKVIHVPKTDLLLFLQPLGKFSLFDLDSLETRFSEAWHEEIHVFELFKEQNLLIVGAKKGKIAIYKLHGQELELIKKFDDFGEIEGAWMVDQDILAIVERTNIKFFDVKEGSIIGTRSIGNERYDPIKWVFWDQEIRKVVMLSFEKHFEIDY